MAAARRPLRRGLEARLRRRISSGRLGTACRWLWRRSRSKVDSSALDCLPRWCEGIRTVVVLLRVGFPAEDFLARGGVTVHAEEKTVVQLVKRLRMSPSTAPPMGVAFLIGGIGGLPHATSAKFFGSRELVWSKLKLQRRILELGYAFLFTDMDVMWLRDPFKHVTAYADMTVSSDVYFGDPDGLGNFPNTGFFHVKPNARTIAMTKVWHESRGAYPGANEQPAFNMIKKRLVAELRLRLRYLDPAHVGGFCCYGKDLEKVVTMHANYCVGLGNKMRDLRSVLDDWKRYTKMPPWEKHRAKWTVPGACIK